MTTHLPTRRPRERQHVLGEDLFRHILIGERKRADRLDQPLVVMMLTAAGIDVAQSAVIWRQAIEAIFEHIRETDVVGWLERRGAIGIVLHELRSATEAVSRDL